MEPCQNSGWYCNGQGHVTHMILSQVGLQCKAVDLAPLAEMKDLHSFVLDRAPGISGAPPLQRNPHCLSPSLPMQLPTSRCCLR